MILGVYNIFLCVGNFKTHVTYDIPSGKYAGTSKATFDFVDLEQRLIGTRIWAISSLEDTERKNYFEFRLFSPMELEYDLNDYGFKVVEKIDISKEQNTSSFMYVVYCVCVSGRVISIDLQSGL
ncbi:hypothetical protein D0962_13805 [Leptolyngbyaceae cyanobacterium CCMR0082]|uniref:Uncharacterized protein n=1 Tax=Adonisia turfae CCMR0082 TaxID=2304604 RepID=A0A6M0S5U8_9CYAN|nr:hypothetical protein [Adonisia turfae]NEZ63848.1 hypothetical protein [Adonisia turfae CCMR0082]